MSKLLTTLQQQIEVLEQTIKVVDFADYQEYYFDEQLFFSNKIIEDKNFYLEKIKQTYQALAENVRLQNIEQITFLSEVLVNQITALTREIATHKLRQNKTKTIIEETLAEKHSRHLDYLRRLQEMKYELELSPEGMDYKKIATLDNRIYRCEQAIKKIENDLENDSLHIDLC
ncbi:primosomal replication protein PriC [Gilliamella sp. wkB112]|uniref:primosomal replication protein PriC n=1 Tax=Gilliamella sp. wkB112 TaxID=3120257 RepID=UPI00080E481C|nr:primosomal replication protein PriC [Gilliamella apicola]OCG00861.1 hypothetical protein A9G12_03605 [Gilliamella apicola]